MIKEIGNLKFHRALIPVNAFNLNNHKIDIAYASNKIECATTYARFFKKIGQTHVS